MAALLLSGCATVPEAPRARDVPAPPAAWTVAEPRPERSSPIAPVTFDEYVRQAFEAHPGLRAAFHRWQAARERLPQVRALADPTLSFEYFVEQMDQRYRVSLTQAFPAFGTRRRQEQRAAAEARAAWHAFESERFNLYARLVRAFQAYHYLARATAITAENVRLLTELEAALSARYDAGAASFADLIKVQIEQERLTDRLTSLADQRGAQSAGLAALLNAPADNVLPWPRFEPAAPLAINEAELADALTDANPEIAAASETLAAAGQGVELARRAGWPRLMAGVGWMVMPDMDDGGDESDIGLMAGLSLPLWRGSYRAAHREAQTRVAAVTHERANLLNRLRADLSLALFDYRDAERRHALFHSALVPKADQALAVARQAYADGQGDFMSLIDAQRTRLEFQLLAERATMDREIALSEIVRLTGGRFGGPKEIQE